MEAEEMRKERTRASDELLDCIRDSYTTRKGWNTARKYIQGLMSGAERSGKTGGSCRNSWENIRPISFSLFLQGGGLDPLYPLFVCCLDGCIQAPQVHVRRNHEGYTLKHGIPGGDLHQRWPILVFECSLCQPLAVVRDRHDLKLYRTGSIAGEQVNGKLQAAVRAPVRNQLGISLGSAIKLTRKFLEGLKESCFPWRMRKNVAANDVSIGVEAQEKCA